MTRRVAVTCDDGHNRLLVAAFLYTEDTDPGSPNRGTWAWRWDNGPATTGLGEVSEQGLHRWYTTPDRPATSRAPDGSWKVSMLCPRCRRNVTRAWTPWAEALEALASAGQTDVPLRGLDAAKIGVKRGSERG